MDFIKAIIALITSFFNRSTAKTVEEVKLADAQTKSTIETIRANENAAAVQQQQKTQEALQDLQQKHEEEREHAKANPNADDDQFGSSW